MYAWDSSLTRTCCGCGQVSAAILGEPHALEALLALGWEKAPGAAGGEPEVLVAQRGFSMADVRLVEEAKDALKKAQRDALTKTVHPPGALPPWPPWKLWELLRCALARLRPGPEWALLAKPAQLGGQQVKRTCYTAGSETAVGRCMTTAARRCISAQQAGARTGRFAQAGGSPGQQGCLARQHTQKRGCSQVRERSRTAGQEGVRAASRAEVLAALAADRAERSAAAPSQGSKAQARPLASGV